MKIKMLAEITNLHPMAELPDKWQVTALAVIIDKEGKIVVNEGLDSSNPVANLSYVTNKKPLFKSGDFIQVTI